MSGCRLFHEWSRWGDVEVIDALWAGRPAGSVLLQRRLCERCGKVEQRQVHA